MGRKSSFSCSIGEKFVNLFEIFFEIVRKCPLVYRGHTNQKGLPVMCPILFRNFATLCPPRVIRTQLGDSIFNRGTEQGVPILGNDVLVRHLTEIRLYSLNVNIS